MNLPKLLKYLLLIEAAFERQIALTGKERDLPLMRIKVGEERKIGDIDVIPVVVELRINDQNRIGLTLLQLKDDRIRINAIPFDPDRVEETISSERGKEFLETILLLSFELYEADYALKYVEENKRAIIVQNDLLAEFITYDEFEEEFFGVANAIVSLYNVLKDKGFEPKLFSRKVAEEGKIDDSFLDLFYT